MNESGKLTAYKISIHALREEGDAKKFQTSCPRRISIHALREEGDLFKDVGEDN